LHTNIIERLQLKEFNFGSGNASDTTTFGSSIKTKYYCGSIQIGDKIYNIKFGKNDHDNVIGTDIRKSNNLFMKGKRCILVDIYY